MWIDKPHIWHIREFGELDWGLKRDWSDWIFQWFMAKATTIAVSQAVCEEVLPINIAQRTTVVYNGIAFERDFDRFLELSKARQNRTQAFTFAIIGAIRPSKGQYEAIQAFSQVVAQNSAVRLLIVGDGEKEYVAMCKGLVDTYGIAEKVEFYGYKPDPYKAMFAADAILMCSQNEGMGRVTVEAMSACRPVIGFDQAGTSELIEHGKNGLLYHGIQELIDCMLHLAGNPLLGEEMGRYGWELARKKYTVEKYAEQVYQVVRSVYQSQGSK